MPIIIFIGVDGSMFRLSNQLQKAARGVDRMTMKNGLRANDRMPGSAREWSSAHQVSEMEFWWKTIQKTMTMRKITIKAIIRFRSGTAAICTASGVGGRSTVAAIAS